MRIEDIITAKNKVKNVYQLVNDLISYHGMEMLDLAYPKHDGEQDAEAVAEMMLLRQSANSLADACKLLVSKLTDAIEVENENEDK